MNAPFDHAEPPRISGPTIPPGKYRLRVQDYLILDEAGAFRGEETELVDGNVIVMSPEWRPHLRIKDELAYRVRRALEAIGNDLFVGTGGSVALSDIDQPRPDIILTREIEGEGAVPRDSIALLVEVASTTLANDVKIKTGLYARYGIPEYWIANVDARMIHQMWNPVGGIYTERRDLAFGDPIMVPTIAGLSIDTTNL